MSCRTPLYLPLGATVFDRCLFLCEGFRQRARPGCPEDLVLYCSGDEDQAVPSTLLVLGIPAGVAYNFYSKEPLLGSD